MLFERPEFLEGVSFKTMAQGAAIGAVLTIAIGFNWFGPGFGWVTGGSAKEMALKSEKSGAVSALASVCAARFQQDAGASAHLVELKKIDYSWDQGSYLQKGGWATLPGNEKPDSDVAQACAALLVVLK